MNVALGKCVSIENTTATLEDCDGSSQVGSAGFSVPRSWTGIMTDKLVAHLTIDLCLGEIHRCLNVNVINRLV